MAKRKKLKVLMLFNSPYSMPRGYDWNKEFSDPDNMYTENDVYKALVANGYEVSILGIFDTLEPLFEEVNENRPDVIFNLVEVFNDKSHLEKNMAAVLEMLEIPYTGASSDNIYICNNKGLSKKILTYHRIKTPKFHIFYREVSIKLPSKLNLPFIIKPLCEEASRGISLASIVDSEEALIERIKYIHENMKMDAIAEEYIEGREFYVSVMGHRRLKVFPPREMVFGELPEDARVATYKAKWDDQYREKWGIESKNVNKISEELEKEILDVTKRAYRALNIRNYIRFDMRISPQGKAYIIEANTNPCIAKIDEFAQSASRDGINYKQLIKKIVLLAFQEN